MTESNKKPKTVSAKKKLPTLSERISEIEKKIIAFEEKIDSVLISLRGFSENIHLIDETAKRANVFLRDNSEKISEAVTLSKRCNVKVNSNLLSFKDQLDTVVNENTNNTAQIGILTKSQSALAKSLIEINSEVPVIHQELDIIKSLSGIAPEVEKELNKKTKKEKKNGTE